VAILSTVLDCERAIEVNIAIIRGFVPLREIMSTHKDLARKLDNLERKLGEHDKKFSQSSQDRPAGRRRLTHPAGLGIIAT